MCNDFSYNFTLIFRSIIYEKTKIMVLDMDPVIKALKIFINDVLLKHRDKVTYRIEDLIDMDVDNNSIEWSINTNQKVDFIIELTLENINNIFEDNFDGYYQSLKEEGILDYPKEFFGKIFVCSIFTVVEVLKGKDIEKEEKVFDIFTFKHNGICNVVY